MTARDLIDAFETMADAPNGVEKLRDLVLVLAVQGRLVPQNPTEDDACELLGTLAGKRDALVDDGVILKPRSVPNGPVTVKPFEIPESWEWSFLGQVGAIVGGGTPKSKVSEYWADDGVPWLTPADMRSQSTRYISRGSRDISDEGLSSSSARLVPEGTVLFSSRAPIGHVGIAANPLSTNQGFKSCVPYEPEMSEFIYLFLWQQGPVINASATGTTFKEVSGKQVAAIPIPVPPLAEQHRIVAKVDELMSLLDRLEAARDSRDTTRASLRDAALQALQDAEDAEAVQAAWSRISENMDELFTDPADVEPLRQSVIRLAVRGQLVSQDPKDEPAETLLARIQEQKIKLVAAGSIRKPKELPPVVPDEIPFEVPSGWEWTRLGWITSEITSGSRGWKRYYADSGSTFIRSQDIKHDRLDFDQRAFVQLPKSAEGQRTQVKRGDWLLTITGANVGKCALLQAPPRDAYVSQHIALIRPIETEMGQYGHLWLTGAYGGRGLLLADSYGAKPGLNLTQLRELVMPVPPLKEQHRIVSMVANLIARCDELETRLRITSSTQADFTEAAASFLGT